ncbi:MAG: twitching motility protein PilT [Nitrosopumilus sp.]|nr:twitching motility protein PilT [Nitrosopumilus sp.]CAI9831717.1 conserved hypothetical protein [Nitrosopumilaceae archaeon]MDA7941021.1 twitching motility protein PilT [Nitrosopumilus sp.]MDA7942581.1 twitching motility protein PilT [Nitrosopumilus sp.]MDA7944454.1 twitching motility protein PilT [Nitrosopumilus sp.]
MARVVCDTSFLIHLATRRIHNIDSLEAEVGQVRFAVPLQVVSELRGLRRDPARSAGAGAALERAAPMERIKIPGDTADGALAAHAGSGVIIATMDRGLKRRVREAGGSVMSFHGDRIVLETH